MLNSNYNIRKNAQASLKKLRVEEANKLILPLINTFTTTLEALNLFENTESLSRKEETNGNSDTESASSRWPSSKGLCEFINCVSSFNNFSDDALQTVSFNCLILSSSPLAKQVDPKLYEKFLSKLLALSKQVYYL